jgi:major membrane immunogen (membrane-anchored lipoprotein)
MPTEKSIVFGILVFSGLVIMTGSSRIRGGLNWVSKLFKSKDHKQHGSSGDFVIRGNTRNFRERKWKDFVSVDEGKDDTECELEIRNDLEETLLLCWITVEGKTTENKPI